MMRKILLILFVLSIFIPLINAQAQCNTNEECPNYGVCNNNTCVSPPEGTHNPCREKNDCPLGEWCTDGTCEKFNCRTSQDCRDNGLCPNGCVCSQEGICSGIVNNKLSCVGDDACAKGQRCEREDCRSYPSRFSDNDNCFNTGCVPGLELCDIGDGEPCDYPGQVCTGNIGYSFWQCAFTAVDSFCRTNSDCAPNMDCRFGTCRAKPPCNHISECGVDEVCLNTRANVYGGGNRFTDLRGYCADGSCFCQGERCTSSTQCPGGSICMPGENERASNVCVHICSSDSECPQGKYCGRVNLRSGSWARCLPGCTSNSQCTNGNCVNGRCVSCSSDAQCNPGTVCQSGNCVSPCTSQTCPSGSYCNLPTGRCSQGCRSNANCPISTSCQNNQCVSVAVSVAAQVRPGVCTSNADCADPSLACFQGTCETLRTITCGEGAAFTRWSCSSDQTSCLFQTRTGSTSQEPCNELSYCNVNVQERKVSCIPKAAMGSYCEGNVECTSGNCSTSYCAPPSQVRFYSQPVQLENSVLGDLDELKNRINGRVEVVPAAALWFVDNLHINFYIGNQNPRIIHLFFSQRRVQELGEGRDAYGQINVYTSEAVINEIMNAESPRVMLREKVRTNEVAIVEEESLGFFDKIVIRAKIGLIKRVI